MKKLAVLAFSAFFAAAALASCSADGASEDTYSITESNASAPLVPGAGIYYTVYAFITGDNAGALFKGVETLKIAGAIALGIVLVLALPRGVFRVFAAREKR